MAIQKTAAGGEINTLDPGNFGPVTITKSITIDGGGGHTAGVIAVPNPPTDPPIDGIIINAGPTDKVILRNLDVNGDGSGLDGIKVAQAGKVYIDNVIIYGFTLAGIDITDADGSVMIDRTRLINNGVGLSVSGADAAARISDSTVQQNTTGLSATGGGRIISFNNNRLNGNDTNGAPTNTVYQR